MKKNVLISVSNIFYLKFFTFLFSNFLIKNYKNADYHPYMRMLYRSDNNYYYINYYKLYYYLAGVANAQPVQKVQFSFNDQYLESEEDVDKISLGIFKNNDVEDLIVIRNYVYAVKYETYYCYFKINEINGLSPSNGEILTCFYQDKNTNEIIANNLNIDITNNNISNLFTKSQSNNNGAKYIRSILSQDET